MRGGNSIPPGFKLTERRLSGGENGGLGRRPEAIFTTVTAPGMDVQQRGVGERGLRAGSLVNTAASFPPLAKHLAHISSPASA